MKYYFNKNLNYGFEESILRVKEELANEAAAHRYFSQEGKEKGFL